MSLSFRSPSPLRQRLRPLGWLAGPYLLIGVVTRIALLVMTGSGVSPNPLNYLYAFGVGAISDLLTFVYVAWPLVLFLWIVPTDRPLVRTPGRWIVYMGRYDNAEQANRKKAELRGLGIDFRDVNTSGLAPGIALGTFSSEDAAREGLQQVERRNVRSARVVQERAESLGYSLRLPAIGDGRQVRI